MRRIYFIRRADATGPIKIGCSVAVKSHLNQLSSDYMTTFELLASAPGDFLVERNLHLKFAALRVDVPKVREGRKNPIPGASEWFAPAPTLLSFIERVKANGAIIMPKGDLREWVFAERYLAGETLQQIGSDFGISRERVRQVLRRIGVPSLGHRAEHCRQSHELTPAEIKAVQEYASGERSKAICERHGLSRAQLLTAARRLGVEIAKPGCPVRGDADKIATELRNLYSSGKPMQEIAAHFGWSHKTYVYHWLKRIGVEPSRKPRCMAEAA